MPEGDHDSTELYRVWDQWRSDLLQSWYAYQLATTLVHTYDILRVDNLDTSCIPNVGDEQLTTLRLPIASSADRLAQSIQKR